MGISLDIALGSLEGRVRRREGEVEEKRCARVMPGNEADGLGAKKLGVVTFLFQKFVVAVPVRDAMGFVLEMVDLAHQRAVELVEAALAWPELRPCVAEVPFAH